MRIHAARALAAGVVSVVPLTIGAAPATTALLSEEERQRAARYRAKRTRAEFVTVRTALREVLAAHRDEAPERLVIVTDKYGKPRLRDGGPVFNVTHTRGLGLVALAEDPEVGVDAELIDRRRVTRQLEHRVLAPRELEAGEQASGGVRATSFFERWTCKEAIGKVTGRGITLGFDRLAVSELSLNGCPTPAGPGIEFADIAVAAIDIGSPFAAAVAARGTDWRVRLERC